MTDLLKQLNNSQVIRDTRYNKLKPRGSRFDILYGLCKIYKSLIGKFPLFGSFCQFPKLDLIIWVSIIL